MIKRDAKGLIVQHCDGYPTYLDGGDSAARTGIMALCGSEYDQYRLGMFITEDYKLVRHPSQANYSDPKNTSRDQLIQWAAGVSVKSNATTTLALSAYDDLNFINDDFLPPDVRLYLYRCAKQPAPLLTIALGYPLMFISLLWACFITPKAEQNKMFCMMAVMGWMKLYKRLHPSLEANIREYWSGWPFRDQHEIADAMISKL